MKGKRGIIPWLLPVDIERFWAKVERKGPDECWPWLGTRDRVGYGKFSVRYKTLLAARVAWFITHGLDPGESLVRHTCDFPPCCNPAHLVRGSHQDNSNDAIKRGRRPTGENAPTAKLTNDRAAKILQDRYEGRSIPWIAKKYNVTEGCIIPLIKGKSWKHIRGPREVQKPRLTAEERAEILRRRATGESIPSLARAFNRAIGTIHFLVSGQTWKTKS